MDREGEHRMTDTGRLPLRMGMFLLGSVLMGTGVALFVKSSTGVSPMASIPLVAATALPAVSLGTWTFVYNLVFFTGQVILDRSCLSPALLLQLIPSAIMSAATDLSAWLLSYLPVEGYGWQLLILAAGCGTIALCIALMVSAHVILMPMDGFVYQLVRRTGWIWGNVKCLLDFCQVGVALLLSLLLLGQVIGIREGTLISALTVGPLNRVFRRGTDRLVRGPDNPIN